jgi:hypothetical protein
MLLESGASMKGAVSILSAAIIHSQIKSNEHARKWQVQGQSTTAESCPQSLLACSRFGVPRKERRIR